MPPVSKRSKRKSKRTVKVTLMFSRDEIDLLEKAAAISLEPRATWGYRRLVMIARDEIASNSAKRP